jgi:hypothetical protein
MSHVRQQIREAVATLLTGLTTSGARVYQSRIYPIDDSKLPCLLINTDDEDVVPISVEVPSTQERHLTIRVRCVAKASANLDDTLDTMLAEVETVLGAAGVLSTLTKSVEMAGIRVEMDGVLEKPVGVASMEYQIAYYTASNAPQTAL